MTEEIKGVPSNPAEQNDNLTPSESQDQVKNLLDAFNENKKPSRSDSSSDTFVGDAKEGLHHEQMQRLQETGDSKEGSTEVVDVNPEKRNERDGLRGRDHVSTESAELIASASPTTRVEDGALVDEKGRKRTYVGGRPVMMSDENMAKYEQLTKELGELADDRPLDAIPAGKDDNGEFKDPYYAKRQELDDFVARFA